jgi:lysophospholipase L1-like esterase
VIAVSTLRRVVAIAAVIVAATITAGVVEPAAVRQTAPQWAPVVEQPEAPTCAGVAIVGDSITSWDPPYAGNPGQTWVTTAVASGLAHVGGWARPGARLDEMLANVTASPDAYYLVVMGGTNDIVAGIPVESRLVALEAIIATVGAERVVLSAVAPLGLDPEAGVAWNEALAAHAAASGYAFIDPWSSFREGFGWVAGASLPDTVHPSPATAAVVGQRIAAHLERFAIVDQAGPAVLPIAV